jgi:hypothetical protein
MMLSMRKALPARVRAITKSQDQTWFASLVVPAYQIKGLGSWPDLFFGHETSIPLKNFISTSFQPKKSITQGSEARSSLPGSRGTQRRTGELQNSGGRLEKFNLKLEPRRRPGIIAGNGN